MKIKTLGMVLVVSVMSGGSLAGAAVQGEKPFVEKTDLFEGDLGGFKLYRIPGVVVTAKGTVLAYCEARKNAPADYGEIETHLRRSTDGGKTWSKAVQIAHKGVRYERRAADLLSKEQTVNNPVMIAGRMGSFTSCMR